ncbi:dehydration-responsive element-binding protein 1E [Vigna radiata var. radiata]|uniref:Dehydration-responsive element-binding protein 1E n=1 Tax=Vigna radiata var. radiata TaxID=3916 RepID=A0A1S3UQ28_VIGRR|nr:dehydration-responsive element-binding protein 1E [Vigna radiata var. radiata]
MNVNSTQSLPHSNNASYFSSSPETTSSLNALHSDDELHALASARPKRRAGRRIFKETRHPVYRGVRQRKNNKWVCEVRVPNDKSTRIWLGTYPTAEMAARAHDVAALALRGKSACLNFADSAWRLPLPASTNAKEIRRVAAEAVVAIAAEDSCVEQSENENVNAVVDCKVSSFGVCTDEDGNSSKVLREFGDLDEITVPVTLGFDDMHEWLQNLADEPLRSPSFLTYVRDWTCLEDDVEVSLWSFSF